MRADTSTDNKGRYKALKAVEPIGTI